MSRLGAGWKPAVLDGRDEMNIQGLLLLWMVLAGPWISPYQDAGSTAPVPSASQGKPLEKGAYFAFVDREYIFTFEIIRPGVAILNFVSMADVEKSLLANQVRLSLENRKVTPKLFKVDTSDPKSPILVASMRIRPRSSFGVIISDVFGKESELYAVALRMGGEEFRLEAISGFEFEKLVLKVGKINLGSPDFSDDWRVLRLDYLGTRGK
jgi:hypothetical protein